MRVIEKEIVPKYCHEHPQEDLLGLRHRPHVVGAAEELPGVVAGVREGNAHCLVQEDHEHQLK